MRKIRVTRTATLEHKRHPSEYKGHMIERKENGWGIDLDDEVYKTKKSAQYAIDQAIGYDSGRNTDKPIIVRRGINWVRIN